MVDRVRWVVAAVLAGSMVGCAARTDVPGDAAGPDASQESSTPATSGGAGVTPSGGEGTEAAGEVAPVAEIVASGEPAASSGSPGAAGEFTRIESDERSGPPEWFASTPVLEDGRLTLSSDASARTAREARAAAVDAGVARMRASLGFEPRGASVLLTHVERLPTGWYKAYVMVTASAREQ